MSERYSACRLCRGEGKYLYKDDIRLTRQLVTCPRCDGTGYSGDAVEFYQEQTKEDFRRENEGLLKDRGQ